MTPAGGQALATGHASGVTLAGGSFRDPSGFVYQRDGRILRQINASFAKEFDAFLGCGLYDELAREGLLVAHSEAPLSDAADPGQAHAVIEPKRVPFISYPYEWSFGELKDAALLTLELQRRALQHDFILRDASAYNVQFVGSRPIFIDTLSFEPRQMGAPWAAYKQFCEHFLVPLLLMANTDVRCGALQREHLDGIPLELGSALLPASSWASPGVLLHVHLHARAQRRYAGKSVAAVAKGRSMSTAAVVALADGLSRMVRSLEWQPAGTEWADYVTDTNYTEVAAGSKATLVREYLGAVSPHVVWDLGANTGVYSRVARETAPLVVSFDIDPAAVERNYREAKAKNDTGILPLLLDLMNPSPAHGWGHVERMSLEERGPADAVMALALVHHLAIARNVPLERVAEYFARLGRSLVIEFVPKSDSQVRRLLVNRPDIFPDYTKEGFERAFRAHFEIARAMPVQQSERWLYLMIGRAPGSVKPNIC